MTHVASLQFHPVGQGLFGTGYVWTSADACFRWFYDCGTSSSQQLLHEAIDRAGQRCCWPILPHDRCGEHFDLGVISHFDKDHVNGITRLLERQRSLKTLLMPYARLDQRLALAFGQTDDVKSNIVQFCANPVSFAEDRWRAQRVLIVRGGAGPEDEETPAGRPELSDNHVDLIVPPIDPLNDEYSDNGNRQTGLLPVGSVLTLRASTRVCWEFRPYNDQHLASEANTTFRQSLQSLRVKLLKGDAAALRQAKTLFDHTFGRRSRARNEISLFLHGRQVGSTYHKLYECSQGVAARYALRNWSL